MNKDVQNRAVVFMKTLNVLYYVTVTCALTCLCVCNIIQLTV